MEAAEFKPELHVEWFVNQADSGLIHLVCDTNVYLSARQAVGVEADGRLRLIVGQPNESPDVALLRSPSIAGIQTRFIVALAVRNELFVLIRGGYDEHPAGLGDARLTAAAVRDLTDLHPLGSASIGKSTHEEPLPDPPLSDHEKNDRQIWGQAKVVEAVLITSDGPLKSAVRQSCSSYCAALSPLELLEIAKAYRNT